MVDIVQGRQVDPYTTKLNILGQQRVYRKKHNIHIIAHVLRNSWALQLRI